MDRRTFIGAVAAAMTAAPLAASAQTGTTVRRIGYLSVGSMTAADAEVQAAPLRALGWVEGRNLVIERRYVERSELLGPMAQELVRLKVELIVAWGTDSVLAAKNATTTIPIIIGSAGDPVGSGLVASLARPGGNITGLSNAGPEAEAKRLSLLRELLPGVQRVGLLEDSTNTAHRTFRTWFEQACRSQGLEPISIGVASADEWEKAIEEMARRRAQVVALGSGVGGDSSEGRALMSAALKYKLPTIDVDRPTLEAGALVYFGVSMAERNERSAAFIDRILRGAKPADLPIEQPTKFELGINLKTAKALGMIVPQSLLLRADQVIQ